MIMSEERNTTGGFRKEHSSVIRIPGDILTYEYKGILYPKTAHGLTELENWEVRPDDVIVISYPKSGTTWMQEIASVIMNNGDLEKVKQRHTWKRVVFLELYPVFHYSQVKQVSKAPHRILDQKPSPRLYRTHLPKSSLPRQIFEKKPKIIYVYRNPKDVLVSDYFYHGINVVLPEYKSFTEFYEDFCKGKVCYGPWHEHVLFWWTRRHEPNISIVSYEDMIKDLKSVILQVANFLERPLPPDKIDEVVHHCSFESMKSNPMADMGTVMVKDPQRIGPKKGFMRKGRVGDWRNHFTVAQSEAFDVLCNDWLKDSDLRFKLKSHL